MLRHLYWNVHSFRNRHNFLFVRIIVRFNCIPLLIFPLRSRAHTVCASICVHWIRRAIGFCLLGIFGYFLPFIDSVSYQQQCTQVNYGLRSRICTHQHPIDPQHNNRRKNRKQNNSKKKNQNEKQVNELKIINYLIKLRVNSHAVRTLFRLDRAILSSTITSKQSFFFSLLLLSFSYAVYGIPFYGLQFCTSISQRKWN